MFGGTVLFILARRMKRSLVSTLASWLKSHFLGVGGIVHVSDRVTGTVLEVICVPSG